MPVLSVRGRTPGTKGGSSFWASLHLCPTYQSSKIGLSICPDPATRAFHFGEINRPLWRELTYLVSNVTFCINKFVIAIDYATKGTKSDYSGRKRMEEIDMKIMNRM